MTMTNARLAGKTAFVTAAGAGIGRATAMAFATNGAQVIATDIDAAALQALQAELAESGADAAARLSTFPLDVTDAAAVAEAAKDAGPVNILFNGAGVVHPGSLLEASDDDLEFAFVLNVRSMFHAIRAFMPGMLSAGGGSIINVASVAGSIKGVPNRFVYSTTKAAVVGLTKSVAVDYVARGIRCNAICPGTVESPSLRERVQQQARANGQGVDEVTAAFVSRQPMGRLGRPGEIATLAVYLASDESAFTTGTTHIIDGGWSN
jgi:2-keto-3-deoxy-L-fuconate dehydrogenase